MDARSCDGFSKGVEARVRKRVSRTGLRELLGLVLKQKRDAPTSNISEMRVSGGGGRVGPRGREKIHARLLNGS